MEPMCLVGFREMAAGYLATAVLLVLLVGFGEVLAFRGVLMRLLLKHGVGFAVATSSIPFGAMHLVNLAFGMSWHAVILSEPDVEPLAAYGALFGRHTAS